ncbi:hypothetical protein FQN60_003373, partial [Etheostoma spectabile]
SEEEVSLGGLLSLLQTGVEEAEKLQDPLLSARLGQASIVHHQACVVSVSVDPAPTSLWGQLGSDGRQAPCDAEAPVMPGCVSTAGTATSGSCAVAWARRASDSEAALENRLETLETFSKPTPKCVRCDLGVGHGTTLFKGHRVAFRQALLQLSQDLQKEEEGRDIFSLNHTIWSTMPSREESKVGCSSRCMCMIRLQRHIGAVARIGPGSDAAE